MGTLSDGALLIDLMNQAGYDLAVPGNHEFDYGADHFIDLAKNRAAFPYLSCNFRYLETNTNVLVTYQIVDYGGVQVAYIGISTPESMTKTAPTHFQDENGNYVYGFCQGENGQLLYSAVQAAVDAVEAQGADYVVAIGHLGNLGITPAYTSEAVISHTTGIDVFIDGHSHESYERTVADAAGEAVHLAQTGTKLNAIGKVVIDPATGEVTSSLVTDYTEKDPATTEYIQTLQADFSSVLDQVVATSDVTLTTMDPATGLRRIRSGETNLGDLVADAYRVVMGADIGMVNGGGIRADIQAGEITYEDIINVHPYGNEMCLAEATGQEILDALELGAMNAPYEDGGFQHVSGLTYTIDLSVPSSVVLDDAGLLRRRDWSVPGDQCAGERGPLRPERHLHRSLPQLYDQRGRQRLQMFMDNPLLQDCTMLDNQLLIQYITENLGGRIGSEYADPYGSGRIQILEAEGAAAA